LNETNVWGAAHAVNKPTDIVTQAVVFVQRGDKGELYKHMALLALTFH
jgi:hypothetical protein